MTDAVGFHFKCNEKRQEYAHSAVIIVCSPTGSVSRYLYGVQFEPRTLRLSLAEASEGKIGTTLDRVLLFCLHYDPAEGSYALAAMNLMRASGVATVLVLGVTLLVFWRREWRKRAMLIEAGSKSL